MRNCGKCRNPLSGPTLGCCGEMVASEGDKHMLRPTGHTSFVIGLAMLTGVATASADDRTDCTSTATVPANA